MNCCGHHQDQHHHHAVHDAKPAQKNKMHFWMMMLCCVLPIVLAAILLFSGNVSGSLEKGFLFLLILICPLSHLLIMPLMMHKNKKIHES